MLSFLEYHLLLMDHHAAGYLDLSDLFGHPALFAPDQLSTGERERQRIDHLLRVYTIPFRIFNKFQGHPIRVMEIGGLDSRP
jgi:hypothetical protein